MSKIIFPTTISGAEIRAELLAQGILEPRHDFTESAADSDDSVPCLRLDAAGRAVAARQLTPRQLDRVLAQQGRSCFSHWCARGCPDPEEISFKRRRGPA